MKPWNLAVMFLLFWVGLALHSTLFLSPIHEAFHYSRAFHQNVDILNYTRTSVTVARYIPSIILNGYWGELFIWTGLALVLGRWGTFFAGYGLGSAVQAPGSFDFTVALARWAEREGGSPSQVAEIVQKNIDNFILVGVICAVLIITRYVLLVYWTYREPAPMSRVV